MAVFIGRDEAEARELLAAIGTRIIREDAPERAALLAEYLDEASRMDRGSLVAEPPAPGAQDSGMGAWHTNALNEFHSVVGGDGIVEFWTAAGAVAVRVGAGDMMLNKAGVEHRYLPIESQEWIIRFGGGADAELVGSDTGREPGPWPL